MKRFHKALIIAVIYMVLGNMLAIMGMQHLTNRFLNSPVLEVFFAPYSFVAGLSTFAGWDWLSWVLELIIFVITIPLFYAMLLIVSYVSGQAKKQ